MTREKLVQQLTRMALWRAFQHFRSCNGSVHAAAIASATLFTLGPFLLLLATVAGIILREQVTAEAVASWLATEIPAATESGLRPLLVALIEQYTSQSTTSRFQASLLLSLWSASALATALRRGFQAIANPDASHSSLKHRASGLLATIGALVLAVLWLSFSAALSGFFANFLHNWRWIMGFIGSFFLFVVLYQLFLPTPRRPAKRAVLFAAGVAAFAWEVTKIGLTIGATWFSGGSEVYGILTIAVAILAAANLAATITLYGAALVLATDSSSRSTLPNP